MWVAYSHSLAMTSGSIESTRTTVSKAIDVAAGIDDIELQAGLLYAQWSVEFMSSDHGAALTSARRLSEVTPRGGDAMKLAGDRVLGTSLLYAGRLTNAQDCLQRVVDLYAAPSDGHNPLLFVYDQRVLARARLARVLSLRGHLDRAYEEARSSFETARASGAGITICWVLQDALCPIALMRGDLVGAEAAVAALGDWATRMNATLWKTMAAGWQGKLLIERGEVARGIKLLSQTLEACERSGWRMCYVQFLAHLAESLAGLGHLDEAGGRLERAIAWSDRHGEGWYQAELTRMKGELILHQPKGQLANEAEDCFRAASDIAREQGALFWELRIAVGLARLRMTQGRHDDVRQILTPVYDRFTEGFDTPVLRAARMLLGEQSA
jgi:tetratricopeptide (TPR) repeat protein